MSQDEIKTTGSCCSKPRPRQWSNKWHFPVAFIEKNNQP